MFQQEVTYVPQTYKDSWKNKEPWDDKEWLTYLEEETLKGIFFPNIPKPREKITISSYTSNRAKLTTSTSYNSERLVAV